MGKIVLTRIDNRMIHGQVASGWIGKSNAGKIVVVDTVTADNEMMRDLLFLAVPVGVKFSVYTREEAIKEYQKNEFGTETIMLIFKNIQTASECYQAGIKFTSLQIGGTGVRKGAQVLEGPITITQEEYRQLEEIHAAGAEIYLQQTVQSKSTKWDEAKRKVKF